MKIDKKLRFWHSVELPDGTVTPGKKPLWFLKLEEQAILEHISPKGKSVLDIGAWDGYFSFAMERLGASNVTASDWHCWVWEESWGSKDSFDFVKQALKSQVNEWIVKAEEIPVNGPRHDIVLVLGVLYHVKNPIALIERATALANDRVVIETEYRNDGLLEPILYLVSGDELNDDSSNWNVPNLAAISVICEMAGLENIKVTLHPELPDRRVFASGEPKRE